MELGTGEALVSFLDEKGAPSVVERAKILFPLSQIGAVTEGQREQIINRSRLYGRYDKVVDRESAFEVLMEEAEAALKLEQEAIAAEENREAEDNEGRAGKTGGLLKGLLGAMVGAAVTSVTSSIGNEVSKKVTGKKSRTTTKDIAGKAVGSAARTVTRQLTRSLLGNLLK